MPLTNFISIHMDIRYHSPTKARRGLTSEHNKLSTYSDLAAPVGHFYRSQSELDRLVPRHKKGVLRVWAFYLGRVYDQRRSRHRWPPRWLLALAALSDRRGEFCVYQRTPWESARILTPSRRLHRRAGWRAQNPPSSRLENTEMQQSANYIRGTVYVAFVRLSALFLPPL